MSRELKFRVWNISDVTGKTMYYNVPSNFSLWNGWCIMQYTWLKDKNWKEIYEGDIVKWDWSIVDDIQVGVIEFYWWAFRFKPAGLPLEYWYYRKECEIIWNIYENPELLKKD